MHVAGWTDRPHVALEFRAIWDAFRVWVRWREWTPSSAVAWVNSQLHDQPPGVRAIVADAYLELADYISKHEPKPASKQDAKEDPDEVE